jgi:hypothetical protein
MHVNVRNQFVEIFCLYYVLCFMCFCDVIIVALVGFHIDDVAEFCNLPRFVSMEQLCGTISKFGRGCWFSVPSVCNFC